MYLIWDQGPDLWPLHVIITVSHVHMAVFTVAVEDTVVCIILHTTPEVVMVHTPLCGFYVLFSMCMYFLYYSPCGLHCVFLLWAVIQYACSVFPTSLPLWFRVLFFPVKHYTVEQSNLLLTKIVQSLGSLSDFQLFVVLRLIGEKKKIPMDVIWLVAKRHPFKLLHRDSNVKF